MMGCFLRKTCFFLAVVGVFLQLALSTDINNTAGEDINGQYLLDMGKKMNDPMLQAIGMAIKNVRQHRCGEWTPWTSCTASTLGYFGIKRRTRTCGKKLNAVKTETDLSICIRLCPPDYVKTTNGFCVKIHNSHKLQVEADKQCKAEGGYLINIDSQVKYEDVSSLTTPDYMYIGGRRKDANSPWVFEYGNQNGFFKWMPGQPNNFTSELCLYLRSNKLMVDGVCNVGHPFCCEIIV